MEYSWTFEQSFLVFLLIVFVSQAVAGGLRSLLPMPLLFGVLFIAGFTGGLLPRDMLLSANMVAVGTIAFNVLVVHSGTMLDFGLLRKNAKAVGVCLLSTLALTLLGVLCLTPLVGRELALLAPGSVVGGGASCAIASRWVLEKNPAISVFPWLVFMFQGLFSVPAVTLALRAEARHLRQEFAGAGAADAPPPPRPAGGSPGAPPQKPLHGPSARVPGFMKTTAYYLGGVMLVSFLNRLAHTRLLEPLGIHININVTALLLGVLLGVLGLLEAGPLFKSDSYGLLILGLMGLMANTMANNELANILRLLPAVLVVFVFSTLVLCGGGVLFARLLGLRPAQGVILTMNSVMGFPVNGMLIANAAKSGSPAEQAYLTARLAPLLSVGTMLVSNGISIFLVSIMVSLV